MDTVVKKDSLTPEEEALMEVVKNEWINLALKKNVDGIVKPLFEKGINWVYTELLKLEKPQIVYCDSLLDAIIKITLVKDMGKELEDFNPQMLIDFNEGKLDKEFVDAMKENYQLKSTYCGWSNFGWVSFYDYFTRIGVINDANFNEYKNIIQSNVFETFEFEFAVFAVQPPVEIIMNENQQLHNPKGHSVRFKDDTKTYHINGREISGDLINKGFTKEQFLMETNEDTRGAMYEIVEARGEGSMLKFLEAYEFASETITHKNGDVEMLSLYRTKETFPELKNIKDETDVPLCWLKLVCPSTGQNYLISTDSSFTTPIEAAKYHRSEDVPFDLDYNWFSRS